MCQTHGLGKCQARAHRRGWHGAHAGSLRATRDRGWCSRGSEPAPSFPQPFAERETEARGTAQPRGMPSISYTPLRVYLNRVFAFLSNAPLLPGAGPGRSTLCQPGPGPARPWAPPETAPAASPGPRAGQRVGMRELHLSACCLPRVLPAWGAACPECCLPRVLPA